MQHIFYVVWHFLFVIKTLILYKLYKKKTILCPKATKKSLKFKYMYILILFKLGSHLGYINPCFTYY